MTDGQTRVVVLLLILLGLEALTQPFVRDVFKGAFAQFNAGLNAGSQGKQQQQTP